MATTEGSVKEAINNTTFFGGSKGSASKKWSRLPKRSRSARLPLRKSNNIVDAPAFDWASKESQKGPQRAKGIPCIKRPGSRKGSKKLPRRSKSMQTPTSSSEPVEDSPPFDWSAYKSNQNCPSVASDQASQIVLSDEEIFSRWYKNESDSWWNEAKLTEPI